MHQFALALIFCLTGLYAQAFDVPALQSGVNDEAHILDTEVAQSLSEALTKIHASGGPQLAVLTVPSLDNLEIEDASFRVAKAWKLGTERGDNGILLMVAPKERKVRIEVGQALEGDLTDAYSRRIIDNDILPEFRSGRYTDGVVAGVAQILLRMNPPIHLQDHLELEYKPRSSRKAPLSWFHILIWIVAFIVLASARGGGRGGGGSSALWFLLGTGLGGGRSSGGRWSGGGGGWSGGGGGFSGGGASGSW